MIKYQEIKLTPTPFTAKVYFGTAEEIRKRLDKDFKGKYVLGNIFDSSYAYVHTYNNNGIAEIVCCFTKMTAGIAAHEAKHIIYELNELIGNQYNYASQEMHAYYLEWLVDQIYSMK